MYSANISRYRIYRSVGVPGALSLFLTRKTRCVYAPAQRPETETSAV